MRSSKALTSTNGIEFAYDDTATLASVLQAYNTGTVSANTWTYFTFTLTATRTAVKAFGLVANGSGFDSADQWLDEVTIGPGSPSFVANGSDTDIRIRFISLDTAATVTVTYGSGGGTSGADAPSTTGSYEFTTRSRVATSSTYDSLVNISTHPTITLISYNTAYSFQRKTWYDGTRYWRAYHDSVDARIEFEYSSDGNTWTENTSARIATSTYDFTVWGDSSNAFIAYTNGFDVEARKAGTYPGTGFSWGAATIVYNGNSATDLYRYPSIAYDSNSKIWLSVSKYQTGSITNSYLGAGSDDAHEDLAGTYSESTANVNGGGSTTGTATQNFIGGFRFPALAIPKKAIITSARPDFVNNWTGTFTTEKARLYFEASDDAATFSSSSKPSSRSNTTNYSTWTGSTESLTDGQRFSSTVNWVPPDVSSALQEVVDRPGWVSGNDVALIIRPDPTGSDGYWFGAYSYENNTTGTKIDISYTASQIMAAQSVSANDISTWGTTEILDSSANSNKYGVIVPRTSGGVTAVWMDGTAIESKNYSGSWDSSPTSVATGVSGLTTSLSAVADSSGNVHLVYINSSNNTVYRQFTSSWQTAVTLDSNSGNAYPSISLDSSNNDLYAFWIRNDDIFYKKGVSTYASGNWDTNATSWQTVGTLTWISSVYSYAAPSFAVWTTGSGTPPIDWDIIPVPEFLWLFYISAPMLPLFVGLRRKKNAAKENI